MKVELVRVGNSRGIRIPKPIIEQCGFEDAVELRIENDHLVIAPARLPRAGLGGSIPRRRLFRPR